MRKIRGFRLALHPRDMRRRLRRAADMQSLGLDTEEAFLRHVDSFSERLHPSVVFDSFGPESKETARLAPIPGLGHTVGLLTLGPGADEWMDAERRAGGEKAKLAERILTLSIEEAVRFVIGLIADEVEQERCELSPIHYVSDPAQLDFLAGKLHASKIGVKIDESIFTPRCSAAFCLSWIAKARRRSKAESGRAKK
ncbi:MAG TPA: hypothetical protein DCM05_16680 [Elusimicrobia bacterium]|nr:hypothetical protein [Elusimicrobiota bacterium]